MQFVAAGPNNLQIPVIFNTQLPVSGSTLVSPNLNPELFEEPKENCGTDSSSFSGFWAAGLPNVPNIGWTGFYAGFFTGSAGYVGLNEKLAYVKLMLAVVGDLKVNVATGASVLATMSGLETGSSFSSTGASTLTTSSGTGSISMVGTVINTAGSFFLLTASATTLFTALFTPNKNCGVTFG